MVCLFFGADLEQTWQKPFRWDRKKTKKNTHHYKSWDQFFQGMFLMIFQLWLSVCRLGSLYTPVGIFWDLPKKMTPNATFSFPVFFSSQFSRLSCLTEDVNYRNHCSFVPFSFLLFCRSWTMNVWNLSCEQWAGLVFQNERHSQSRKRLKNTLPNFNMEIKNDGFQKESPIPGCHFQVPC